MILIHRITNFAIENYQSDIINCLTHNLNTSFISKIVVYTANPKIVLPISNKIQLIVKNGYSDYEMMEYTRKVFKRNIYIFCNPFIKFNHTLLNVNLIGNQYSSDGNDCFIFTKDTKLINDKDLNLIFSGEFRNLRLDIFRKHVWTEDLISDKNHSSKISFREDKLKAQENILVKKGDIIYPPVRKIDIVIVSVDYNDFLSISLENNLKLVENITVVTSEKDKICQELCKKFGVNCIITERMYEDGAVFNKGKAINEGIKSLTDPDWILLLDADICLPDDFNKVWLEFPKNPESLITCERYFCKDYDSYKVWKSDNKDYKGKKERSKWLGYFQLFNSSIISDINKVYPEEFEDAAWSDITFRNKFSKKVEINTTVAHLGDAYTNWKGRKTDKFLSDSELNNLVGKDLFNINQYFDKIYCLNLDRRSDRWQKVSQEFSKFSINVERWSAIDGDNLIESELVYIDKNISEEKASRIGKIENKYSLACLLSHIEIIKNAKARGYKKILIFEDDVIISKDFSEKIKLISKIKWKLFYLGASQFEWNDIEISDGYYSCKKTLGTFAYAIDSSIYDELISLLERRNKSVDNYLSTIQHKYKNECFTIYPNIVMSDVKDSNIRGGLNSEEYAQKVKWNLNNFEKKLKVLLVPDVEGWAFDNIAKSIIKYNPFESIIEYEIFYARELYVSKNSIDYDKYDFIYVFFEGERLVKDSPKVIRGCYSSFWNEDSKFSREFISSYFSKCGAVVFANNYLKNEIDKKLPNNQPILILPDSSDEELFYPIENLKNEEFTVIFVGNTKRKVKKFEQIKQICALSDVNLIVCENVKNQDLVNYYNKADICINFSDSEGGPQTFIESGLCGVPMLIKNNNELSKEIPCFTGENKEQFIDILLNLKKNRNLCNDIGEKARKVCLEKFTFKKTSNNFGQFVIDLYNNQNQKNISTELNKKHLDLTVFIISFGENPNFNDCVESINNQNVKFNIKHIKNVAPMSAAFQRMIDECDTKYYIQVDEDMILDKNAIEILYNTISSAEKNISTVAYMLKDVHLDFDIYGVKIYNHKILKNYPYNLDIISCEVEQLKRLNDDGYDILMIKDVIGLHSPKWTNDLIYERYFDLMEKWKKFKYHWMQELPSKLLQIFQNEPSEQNLYALLGAMFSLSKEEEIRKREKNFNIKDENFERLQKLLNIKKFNHIKK